MRSAVGDTGRKESYFRCVLSLVQTGSNDLKLCSTALKRQALQFKLLEVNLQIVTV